MYCHSMYELWTIANSLYRQMVYQLCIVILLPQSPITHTYYILNIKHIFFRFRDLYNYINQFYDQILDHHKYCLCVMRQPCGILIPCCDSADYGPDQDAVYCQLVYQLMKGVTPFIRISHCLIVVYYCVNNIDHFTGMN